MTRPRLPTIPPPRTRADCANLPRPCPFIDCRHHLYEPVRDPRGHRRGERGGSIEVVDFPSMVESCALDVADRGGATLEEVGRTLSVTRERIRQIEEKAIRKIRRLCQRRGWTVPEQFGE